LDEDLLVVATVEVDSLSSVLVLTKLGEGNVVGIEIGKLLDGKRHCWLVIYSIGFETLSIFFSPGKIKWVSLKIVDVGAMARKVKRNFSSL